MLQTELHTYRIPEIYREFAEHIGETHWYKRVARCNEAIRGNAFLQPHLMHENAIAYQLYKLGELLKRYRFFESIPDHHRFYPAISFAAQIHSLRRAWPAKHAERLKRRVHGAFKNPSDMRGLLLELTVANHFSRHGLKVLWPELGEIDTFDLLVEGPDHLSLEVECKSISNDKGRRITRIEVLDFAGLLRPHLLATTRNLSSGLSAVVTVPRRLPTVHRDRVEFANQIGRAIFSGKSCTLTDGTNIRLGDFKVDHLENSAMGQNANGLRNVVDKVTKTSNEQAILVGSKAGGTLALVLQSQQDDHLLKSVFDTLSDASSQQFTGLRPAMLFAGFDGISAHQLVSISDQDRASDTAPTALRVGVSKFLNSSTRDHVVGVGFLSQSETVKIRTGSAIQGAAYYFPKRESSHWQDAFSGLFRWEE